jgi:Protein of unknown function (DUF1236)
MRKERITLLAGIAALAVVAGAGMASAQQAGSDEHGAKQPNAASAHMNKGSAKMGPGAQNGAAGKMDQNAAEGKHTSGKMGQNAGEQNRGTESQRSAQDQQHGQRTPAGRDERKSGMSEQRDRFGNHENAAQRNDRNGQNTAERERNGLKGLQGNARVNVRINDQQRTQIRETVINARGAPRVDHVNFDIAVGTVVPRTGVRIVPVPETLVRIDPSWRGLNYFVYEEELILVDPNTMTIVAVVNV